MHCDYMKTIVLKHPMTPEKKLDEPRNALPILRVSYNGLISSYAVVIGAAKLSETG